MTPHPITLTVQDADSNVQASVRCYLRNTTKGTTVEKDTGGLFLITNSNGQIILDAANLPQNDKEDNEYDQGDKILIVAYDGPNHAAQLYTVSEDEHTLTLTLTATPHDGPSAIDSQRLMAVLAANTTGTQRFVKVYAVADGELLAHLEVPSNDQRDHVFGGGQGKGAAKGFVIEMEASGLVVTTTVR